MDQYLHRNSHHSIFTKYSRYNTLTHRASTICLDWQLHGQKQQHIRTALRRCNYPDRIFHRLQTKLDIKLIIHNCTTNSYRHKDKDKKTKNIYMMFPYSKTLSYSLKSVCNKVGFQVQVALKDKDNISPTKKGLYIGTSVTTQDVQWNKLAGEAGPLVKDSRNI